jgi:Tol biopolymer transport system component
MTIQPGTRLGPYEILAPLGAGGMGEVWKGRDTRLQRDVAVKILPPGFASNEQFRARFDREAKTISSLNHPNICTLFDVGHEGDTHFLVMELIDGEPLADRLTKGPLPLDQVLKFGAQIADALDRAHKQGIVHRDLKPGNVILTKSGAKLLDFGLAHVSDAAPVKGLTEMPTEARPLTTEGTILGTFQYMAPEQLEGAEADARTDIFALGALLYEMATGQRAFKGDSRTSLIAAIVSSQPAPISSVPGVTPPALDHIVRKCLEKDPDDRWQSAHDVASELRWISEAGSQAGVAQSVTIRRKTREKLAWGLAASLAVACALLAVAYVLRAPEPPRTFRSTLTPPPGTALVPFDEFGLALSPDGRELAFVAADEDGKRRIWLRELSSMAARPVPETDGAWYPFWAPDGQHLGFFADGELRTIDLRGGAPRRLADAPTGRGGSWSEDGVILYAPNITSPIHMVSEKGGEPKPVTAYDAEKHVTHRWPVFLPDGRHFIFVVRLRQGGRREVGQLRLASIDEEGDRVLIEDSTNAAYVEPGYLIYGRGANLYAVRFDASALELSGDPVPIAPEKLSYWEAKNFVPFAASNDRTLVYLPEFLRETELVWYARDGRRLGSLGGASFYTTPRVSPDGTKVAYMAGEAPSGPNDVWVRDLEFDRAVRITAESGSFMAPSWSPDSERLVFVCQPKGVQDLCIKSLRDGSPATLLYESPAWKSFSSWLPDGSAVLAVEQRAETNQDIVLVPIDEPSKISEIVATPFTEEAPAVSPDGRWVVYESDSTGRFEVYVRSVDGGSDQWQISADGGLAGRWASGGREILYVSLDGKLMTVPTQLSPRFRPGTPRELFSLTETPELYAPLFEDVTPDGQRLLFNLPTESRSALAFHLITSWTSLLSPSGEDPAPLRSRRARRRGGRRAVG